MSFASSLGRGMDKDRRRGAQGCREAGGGRRSTASARGGGQWPRHHGSWPVRGGGHVVTRHRVAYNWAQLYFVFSKLFNHLNFKIGIDVLTDVQNSLNFVVLSMKDKEQLYFLDQLQNPKGL
jgi:hypothetical protein